LDVKSFRVPLFPLPEVVLFPGSLLPLHIFEPRYRHMISDLIESGGEFGVLTSKEGDSQVSSAGCCAEILKVERLADGRMNILTRGTGRIEVVETVVESPYPIGLVNAIVDEETDGNELRALSLVTKKLLAEAVRLSSKIADLDIRVVDNHPLDAEKLSYWIASNLVADTNEQLELLEMRSSFSRLLKCKEILMTTIKELAARAALKDALG
jgi:ATP-dependent Lon protease